MLSVSRITIDGRRDDSCRSLWFEFSSNTSHSPSDLDRLICPTTASQLLSILHTCSLSTYLLLKTRSVDMPTKQKAQIHQEHHFEFFGPHVPGLLLLVLPAVLYALVYGCNASGCLQIYPSLSIPGFAPGTLMWSSTAMAVVSGWMLLVLVLHVILPGLRAEGVLLPNGKRLSYKLNGRWVAPTIMLLHKCVICAHKIFQSSISSHVCNHHICSCSKFCLYTTYICHT